MTEPEQKPRLITDSRWIDRLHRKYKQRKASNNQSKTAEEIEQIKLNQDK